MNLLALAEAARLAGTLLELGRHSNPTAEAVRRYGPSVAGCTLGPGADELAAHAIRFADSRGWLNPGSIEAQWRDVGDGLCTLCGPAYKPAGEARLVNHVLSLPSGILYVLGRRGSGKTATMLRIAELLDRQTFVLGIPARHLPDEWEELRLPSTLKRRMVRRAAVDDDEDEWEADEQEEEEEEQADPFMEWLERRLPIGSVLLVDDAGLVLDSMLGASVANRLIKYLVQIVRHRDVILLLTGQYASSISKYVLDADVLLLKPPPKLWQAIERPELRALYTEIEPWWRSLSPSAQKAHVWAVSDGVYDGPCHVTLPTFYSTRLSKNKGAA